MIESHPNESEVSTPCLFVSLAAFLTASPGGVQLCTSEYLATLRAAGFAPQPVTYQVDSRVSVRLQRKLRPQFYKHRLPPDLVDRIVGQAKKENIEFIFLNQVDLAALAQPLRAQLGAQCRIIVLSHGLESVDYFHVLRIRGEQAAGSISKRQLGNLAQALMDENLHRREVDHVFCLSAFETEIERWLGAKSVSWLPRTVTLNKLNWSPRATRLGFVGTLNHPPNLEGLLLFLDAFQTIAPPHVKLRLVGSPQAEAEAIARKFPVVEYLGKLSDEELDAEAATWNAFVHPLFCYARGCSTKLAVALGWQIPIVTTTAGQRGYVWKQGGLAVADTPDELATLAAAMLNEPTATRARHQVALAAESSPTIADIAREFRQSCFKPGRLPYLTEASWR